MINHGATAEAMMQLRCAVDDSGWAYADGVYLGPSIGWKKEKLIAQIPASTRVIASVGQKTV